VKSHNHSLNSPAGAAGGFRSLLQAELARRCARNAQYSLRAFAKYLEVDHSTLSQYLRGKRKLTERAIRKFGVRLGLDTEAIDRATRAEQYVDRPDGDPALLALKETTQDAASLIADWHHYAILELVHLRDFRPDSRWIARVLGISVDEVNIALHRLLRFGLLEMTESGQWLDRSGDTATSLVGFAHATISRMMEQVRAVTATVVKDLPDESYAYSATTLAMDTAALPAARAIVARMRDDLLKLLSQSTRRDDVYHLEIALFPVTRLQCKE
jgi:uncharacterized protein (TIGR02147 family)